MRADRALLEDLRERGRRWFSYVHVVTFEETNAIGNVYFARYVAWQGRCREVFLKEHAPGVLAQLMADFRLMTVHASCEYFEEISAFDKIEILMSLASMEGNRISLDFEYRRVEEDEYVVVAAGRQDVACMKAVGRRMTPIEPPAALLDALRPYQHDTLPV